MTSEAWKEMVDSLPDDTSKEPFSLMAMFIHWRLKSSGLQVIGIGQNIDRDKFEEDSLIKKWKGDEILQYQDKDKEGDHYLLICTHLYKEAKDSQITASLVRTRDLRTSAVTLDLGVWVNKDGKIDMGASKEVDQLFTRLNKTDGGSQSSGGAQPAPNKPFGGPPPPPPGGSTPSQIGPKKPPPEPFPQFPNIGNEPDM